MRVRKKKEKHWENLRTKKWQTDARAIGNKRSENSIARKPEGDEIVMLERTRIALVLFECYFYSTMFAESTILP